MNEWLIVGLCFSSGVLLLLVELFFIPGTTIFGILGSLAALLGISLSYYYFDYSTATWLSISAILCFIFAFIYAIRSKTWEKFAHKQTISGQVGINSDIWVFEGQEGRTVSALRPRGTAIFDGKRYEVVAEKGLIEPDQKVIVRQVEGQKIVVSKA